MVKNNLWHLRTSYFEKRFYIETNNFCLAYNVIFRLKLQYNLVILVTRKLSLTQ